MKWTRNILYLNSNRKETYFDMINLYIKLKRNAKMDIFWDRTDMRLVWEAMIYEINRRIIFVLFVNIARLEQLHC